MKQRITVCLLTATILIAIYCIHRYKSDFHIHAVSTASYLDALARNIALYYEVYQKLPSRLEEVLDGKPAIDFCGKQIGYGVISHENKEFRLTSKCATSGNIVKQYRLDGTNVVLFMVNPTLQP